MILGVTGGIGSGKSLVASILEHAGTPVYMADARAKALMVTDPNIRRGVISIFGEQAYDEGGRLNRSHISRLAFKNSTLLQQLNAVVHPATGQDFHAWIASRKAEGHKLLAKEAAILFESGAYLACDKIVTVYAPQTLRLKRVLARDGGTAEDVADRMRRQWPEAEKINRSDYLIINDGHHLVIPQVLDMRKCLLMDI